MYSNAPPAPPPKPASRMSTPAEAHSPRHPPYTESHTPRELQGAGMTSAGLPLDVQHQHQPQPQPVADLGDQWLPKLLQDKSKQDLADMLSDPVLLSALTHSLQTIHPSLRASHDTLQSALAENVERAAHLLDLEARLAHQRSSTQGQLLSTHALERQWRAKQADMDHALAPFSPASLYQRLSQGLLEQEGVCSALEESFLDGDGDGALATEREANDWVRRYREAKKLYYLRQERKERWDEGRVGGWR